MASDLTFIAADAVPSARVHEAMLASFADYLAGPFGITPAQWPSFLARQGVDLAASRVAVRGNDVLAFALVTRRPEIGRWRVAVMGAPPAARGSGAAPALLDNLLVRAQGEGVPEVELECFAQNGRALALYRGRGFEAVQTLRGWTAAKPAAGAPDSPDAGAGVEALAALEVDRATAFAWLADIVSRIPDLPYAVTPRPLAAAVRPLTCWRRGRAQLVFSVVGGTPTQVHSLVDPGPSQPDAQALLQSLRASCPDDPVSVPPLQRDDLGGQALLRTGFTEEPLHQVLMVRTLRRSGR